MVTPATREQGARVRMARRKKGLTQRELSDAVGIRQPTLSGYENGETIPGPTLVALALMLGVPVETLEPPG